MIAAIVVVALVATMSSAMATWNNWVVQRKFPGVSFDMSPDTPPDIYVRVTCYRLVAQLFYYQSLVFWGLLCILVVIEVIHGGWAFCHSAC